MVKLGQGRSRNSSSSAVVDGVVADGSLKESRRFPVWQIIMAAACMAIIGLIAVYFMRHSTTPKESPVIAIPSEQQALAAEIIQLKKDKPANSAPVSERTAYYDKLFFLQGELGAYGDAIETFKTREAISKSGLKYGNYFYLAQYYCKVGDSNHAHQALAATEALLPATDDLENGFSRANTLASIQDLSQDCQL